MDEFKEGLIEGVENVNFDQWTKMHGGSVMKLAQQLMAFNYDRSSPDNPVMIEKLSDEWAGWWPWVCARKAEIEFFVEIGEALGAKSLREQGVASNQISREMVLAIPNILKMEKKIKALYNGLDGLLFHAKSKMKSYSGEWGHHR